jgi:hypothetical protein
VEAVHVFSGVNGVKDLGLVDVLGQGQLTKILDLGVFVVLLDQIQELGFGMSSGWLS